MNLYIKRKLKDHPFAEVVKACSAHVAAGHSFHQKFTCSSCGARQTMEEPNNLYTTGQCEECNHITNILETGCNYLLVLGPLEANKAT